jgi:hypothetical protein
MISSSKVTLLCFIFSIFCSYASAVNGKFLYWYDIEHEKLHIEFLNSSPWDQRDEVLHFTTGKELNVNMECKNNYSNNYSDTAPRSCQVDLAKNHDFKKLMINAGGLQFFDVDTSYGYTSKLTCDDEGFGRPVVREIHYCPGCRFGDHYAYYPEDYNYFLLLTDSSKNILKDKDGWGCSEANICMTHKNLDEEGYKAIFVCDDNQVVDNVGIIK